MAQPTPPGDREAAAAAIDNAAALFGVALQPDWRDVAITHFTIVATAARLVADFPLDDEAEYAPVFLP